MTELQRIVSFADARPIELLSRAQLWRIADAHQIPYPRDATKQKMIALLEGSDIDVTKPASGIRWTQVNGRDEHGHPSSFIAPNREPGQSAREGVQSSSILQARIAETEQKNDAQAEEILKLRKQNEDLVDLLKRLESKLDEKAEPKPKKPSKRGQGLTRLRALKAYAKAEGIDFQPTIKLAELEKLVESHNGENAP